MARTAIAILCIMLLVCMRCCVARASSTSGESGGYCFYVFGSVKCPHCEPMKEFLEKTYGADKVFFCDVYEKDECYKAFLGLVYKLDLPGMLPTTFIVNGTLRAILVGEWESKKLIDSLLKYPVTTRIPVFVGPEPVSYIVLPVKDRNSLLWELKKLSGELSVKELVAKTLSLSLLDSVNPCTFIVYSMLLVTVSLIAGARTALKAAFSFTAAVFTAYTLMGLGLSRALGKVPGWVGPVLAVAYGVFSILRANLHILRERTLRQLYPGEESVVCPACREAEGRIDKLLTRATNPVLWALTLGFIVSITLLPCTAGPYIVFNTLIAGIPLTIAVPLLILYNIVFITPLLALGLCTGGVTRAPVIASFMKRNARVIETICSTILVIIGLAMLLT